ncbi:MAG: hypothetical protein ACKN9V_02935 [Pseudomonadota bacterium]
MSLKVVHLFLILCSIALSGLFGGWCLQNYAWDTDPLLVSLGYLSLSALGGLVFYLFYFLKKTKGFGLLLIPLAALLFKPQTALACAVCQFGTPDSPLVRAIREGIWILLFLLVPVLAGFLGLFIFWAKRDKKFSG